MAEEGNNGSEVAEGSEGQFEWCGKLQHIVSGQARYFRGCPQLTDTLLQMMQEHSKGLGVPAGPQSQEALQQHAEAAAKQRK